MIVDRACGVDVPERSSRVALIFGIAVLQVVAIPALLASITVRGNPLYATLVLAGTGLVFEGVGVWLCWKLWKDHRTRVHAARRDSAELAAAKNSEIASWLLVVRRAGYMQIKRLRPSDFEDLEELVGRPLPQVWVDRRAIRESLLDKGGEPLRAFRALRLWAVLLLSSVIVIVVILTAAILSSSSLTSSTSSAGLVKVIVIGAAVVLTVLARAFMLLGSTKNIEGDMLRVRRFLRSTERVPARDCRVVITAERVASTSRAKGSDLCAVWWVMTPGGRWLTFHGSNPHLTPWARAFEPR